MPLSKLSCDNCRAHKVRCTKDIPACERCRAGKIGCHYSQRRARTTKPSTNSLDAKYEGVIDKILRRLDRLEVAVNASNPSPKSLESNRPLDTGYFQSGQNSSTISEVQSDEEMSDDNNDEMLLNADIDPQMSDNIPNTIMYNIVKTASASPLSAISQSLILSDFEIWTKETITSLKKALSDMVVENQRRHFTPEHEEIQFPEELVHKWIRVSLEYSRTDLFVALIDFDLMSALPKFIKSPYVHLDPAILFLYYTILHCGSLLTNDFPNPSLRIQLEKVYARSLTLWARCPAHDENIVQRLGGVVLATWTAIINHDFDNAWKFHCEACHLARLLKYDKLDDPSSPTPPNEHDEQVQSKRKGFWQLVHTDYIFRMYFGKPAVITSSKFHVNFPSSSPEEDTKGLDVTIGEAVFVLTSRIAFLIGGFYQLIDSHPVGYRSMENDEKIDRICDDVESLMVEWKIEELIQAQDVNNRVAHWTLADLLSHGYGAIIMMQYYNYHHHQPSPSSSSSSSASSPIPSLTSEPRVLERYVRVSRKLLHSLTLVAQARVRMGVITLNLAGAYSFIALAALFIINHSYLPASTSTPTPGFPHSRPSPTTPTSHTPDTNDITLLKNLSTALRTPELTTASSELEETTGLRRAVDMMVAVLERFVGGERLGGGRVEG